ncbi:hypothetical protein FA15DRAFT_696755 [Coprinopsis marcescibilis]|uniref:Uncharacterized protein n=1 Tax=Coprinopsis marcescibilis TaxID=230819 RepID=A0A5C3KKA4_COPMA|nr:hypothetical protein FA15DRAFT_696755 [Coprinopsis marcescibilis]
MKITSPASFSLFFAALTYSTTSATDLRGFTGTSCTGTFSVCTDIASGRCCLHSASPVASVRAINVSASLSTVWGYAAHECSTSLATVSGSTLNCLSPSFAMFSTRWTTLNTREISEDDKSSISTPDCVSADTFGYIDETTGQEVLFKIPEERREVIFAALAKGDVGSVKASALGLEPL